MGVEQRRTDIHACKPETQKELRQCPAKIVYKTWCSLHPHGRAPTAMPAPASEAALVTERLLLVSGM